MRGQNKTKRDIKIYERSEVVRAVVSHHESSLKIEFRVKLVWQFLKSNHVFRLSDVLFLRFYISSSLKT